MTTHDRLPLGDEAASYVRELIIAGELKPGEPVRSEMISEALDISTTPAREALQLLRLEGFLVLIPRRGFIVAPLTGADIADLFTAQALIAGELAARAAKNASDQQLHEMSALHEALVTAAADRQFDRVEQLNHDFHRTINHASGSRKMAWLLGLITRYVPRHFYARIPGWSDTTTHDHTDLLLSIVQRDPERARQLMTTHIEASGALLAAYFDDRVLHEASITISDAPTI